jgi:hypothetical protein
MGKMERDQRIVLMYWWKRVDVLSDGDCDGSRAGLLSSRRVLSSNSCDERSGDDGETHLDGSFVGRLLKNVMKWVLKETIKSSWW